MESAMKKLLAGALVLAAMAFLAAPVSAATAQAAVAVSATVINNCTITTTPVAFGNYDPLSAVANNNSGTVVITCTKGAATTVTLGNGNNFNVTRRMIAGANFLNYELYQPPSTVPGAACSYAAPVRWGTAGGEIFTPGAAPSKVARTYNVCGQIPAAQDLAAATFNDSVVATVNF
jgi:spore coat protein U-like protein